MLREKNVYHDIVKGGMIGLNRLTFELGTEWKEHNPFDLCAIWSFHVPNPGDRRRGLHIIVGERGIRMNETFYFGLMRGPGVYEMKDKELGKFMDEQRGFLIEKYRVPRGKIIELVRGAALFMPPNPPQPNTFLPL